MIKLKRISLTRLHKLETKGLVFDVIDILEKHNLKTLRLEDFYALLTEQKKKMNHLTTPYGKHILTEKLVLLHRKRLKIASYIAMQVSEVEKMDWDEKQKLAKTAKSFSDKFLTYLGRKSRVEVTVAILIFFSSLRAEEHSDVYEALVGMGLQAKLDDLEKTNNRFQQLYSERDLDIKRRPKTGDVYIEREAHNLLRHFFWKIDYYQNTYKEIDYSPLIKELNVELTRCSKTIKTRIATNKRRARKRAAATAKLKAEASKAKDKPKIEPETNSEIKPQINKNINLDKNITVNPLSTDTSRDIKNSTSKNKKKNAKGGSAKKDSKYKGDTNDKDGEGGG